MEGVHSVGSLRREGRRGGESCRPLAAGGAGGPAAPPSPLGLVVAFVFGGSGSRRHSCEGSRTSHGNLISQSSLCVARLVLPLQLCRSSYAGHVPACCLRVCSMDLVVGGADGRPRGSSARKSRARTRRSIPGSSQDRKTFTGAAGRRVSSWGEDTAEVARGEDAARSATRRAAASASARRDASNVREADSARAVAASAPPLVRRRSRTRRRPGSPPRRPRRPRPTRSRFPPRRAAR